MTAITPVRSVAERRSRARSRSRGAVAAMAAVFALLLASAAPAGADPIASGSALGFGTTITLGGEEVIPPTPLAEVTAPQGDQTETVIEIPAQPIVLNGTLIAAANVHTESDIPTGLTVVEQRVPGPYNARGLGQIENLELLYEIAGEGVPLVSAALIRAEAAAVCSGGAVSYTANSEIVDLRVGGEPVALNEPVQQIIDGISGLLGDTGLNAIVDVQRNVVTELEGGGIAVDALVVTILSAAGEDPLAQVRLAHGEVGPTECAPPVVAEVAQPAVEELPRTGGAGAPLVAGTLLAAGLGAATLRRRLFSA